MTLPKARLDVSQTRFWHISTAVRILVGSVFWKRYGSCLVLDDACYAIAVVEEGGRIRELDFPHKRFKMHEIVNQPPPHECECMNTIDMEVEGPWRNRCTDRHHPMCIYNPYAEAVFGHFYGRGLAAANIPRERRTAEALGIDRPDCWTRKEEELKGASVITTAGR